MAVGFAETVTRLLLTFVQTDFLNNSSPVYLVALTKSFIDYDSMISLLKMSSGCLQD